VQFLFYFATANSLFLLRTVLQL